jgi:hypothetical protein
MITIITGFIGVTMIVFEHSDLENEISTSDYEEYVPVHSESNNKTFTSDEETVDGPPLISFGTLLFIGKKRTSAVKRSTLSLSYSPEIYYIFNP